MNDQYEFDPVAEEDLFDLMPDGDYDFFVKNSRLWTAAKTGNKSIKVDLAVYDGMGKERILTVFLSKKYMFLFKHFFDSIGLERSYAEGKLNPEILKNLSGVVRVGREIPEEGSKFFPKNVALDFIKKTKETPPVKKDDFDDDIPL